MVGDDRLCRGLDEANRWNDIFHVLPKLGLRVGNLDKLKGNQDSG